MFTRFFGFQENIEKSCFSWELHYPFITLEFMEDTTYCRFLGLFVQELEL